MEREVGGGIGMGDTCKPMAVSFQCMTKSTTIKKKIFFFKKHQFWTKVHSITGDMLVFHKHHGRVTICMQYIFFV